MAFRYRLLPFTAADVADSRKLFLAIREEDYDVARYLSLTQWDSVIAHLAALDTRSLLIQSGVRDPDFLQEYEAFYARQHRQVSRHCVRLHAFSISPPLLESSTQEQTILDFVDAAPRESYLGFSTIRPLRHAPVGPTILVDSPVARSQAKDKFPVHIAGVTFSVEGTPFLQQDSAVGACAQACIWMALRTMRRRSGNTAYSPTELTLSGTRLDRVSTGRHAFNVRQMLDAIQASGHDSLAISVTAPKNLTQPSNGQLVLDAAQPYLQSGIPVILVLRHPISEGHTVVAIGEARNSDDRNVVTHLVVHNDNVGPYQLLPATVPLGSDEYSLSQTNSLVVALPNGVLMSAAEADSQARAAVEFWRPMFAATVADSTTADPKFIEFRYRTYLCSRHAFRQWARNCKDLGEDIRQAYRTQELPHQVWIVEIHDAKNFMFDLGTKTRIGEVVMDAGADALHGDGVMYVRLTHHMFKLADFEGGVLIRDANTLMYSKEGSVCCGMPKPWADDEVTQ